MRLFLVVMSSVLIGACAQPETLSPASAERRAAADQADLDRRAAVRMELASGYFSRGQYETALDEIRLALAARPDMGAAYNLRGLIYSAMGDAARADESFLRALAINPRDADAMHNRAWFLCQEKRFDEADRLFAQTLAQPNYRDAPRTLLAQGVCNVRAGRLIEAEQRLSRAYELDAANPTTALNLAEVLYRRGEYERARIYVRRVNQRDETSSAQTLWLAARIENRLGNKGGVEEFGRQLRNRFPTAPETVAFERGRFDD